MSSSEKKKTILIIGVSSFVGSNLAEHLKDDYHVIGSYHENPIEIEGVLTFSLDILRKDLIKLSIKLFNPEITIYCAGMSSIEDCEKNMNNPYTLNTLGVFNVTSLTEQYKSMFIYISTAYIFSGDKRTWEESDVSLSNSVYGKSKSSSESFLRDNILNYMIFRCCDFYGRAHAMSKLTWFDVLQRDFFENKDVVGYRNVKRGFLDIVYLAILIKKAIEMQLGRKTIHVSTTNILSERDFFLEYARVFNESCALVSSRTWDFPQIKVPVFQAKSVESLEYTIDVSGTEKLLNFKMPSIKESLEFTRNRFGGNTSSLSVSEHNEKVKFI